MSDYESPQEAAEDPVRTSPFAHWAQAIPPKPGETSSDYVRRVDARRREISEMNRASGGASIADLQSAIQGRRVSPEEVQSAMQSTMPGYGR